MKKTLSLIVFLAVPLLARSQGTIQFANSGSTLLSANGTPMPVSSSSQFIFGLFLAPSTTVSALGQTASFTDAAFQTVAAYNSNSPTLEGRITSQLGLVVAYPTGSTVDFVIRGWSANAGATWAEALATWNNGVPLVPMFIGSSTVGNDLVIGGGVIAATQVFGIGQMQVPGFDMLQIPEPSSVAITALGAMALGRFRRRSP